MKYMSEQQYYLSPAVYTESSVVNRQDPVVLIPAFSAIHVPGLCSKNICPGANRVPAVNVQYPRGQHDLYQGIGYI